MNPLSAKGIFEMLMRFVATATTDGSRWLAVALLVLGVGCGGGGGRSSGGAGRGEGGGSGGTTASSGGAGSAGASAAGGSLGTGGASGTGGTPVPCAVAVISHSTSSQMATVGIVEWSTTVANPTSATIVYSLNDAGADILNKGGTAPVDLTRPNHHTLLLGLKPASTYTFHVEVTAGGTTCQSDDQTLTTGTLSGAPRVTRSATTPAAQAGGFIITSTGISGAGDPQAYIVDADGTVVWMAAAPTSCSRARMDYEGNNMWMIALNVLNTGGEMRFVSMDGATTQNDVSGLAKAHHDFTVRKGGMIATMVWSTSGVDPESDLVERALDGTVATVFHIGANLYKGGPSLLGSGSNTYHSNALLYHDADDSYTIGDRNPNLFVKVTRAGAPIWQFGGDCSGAPAPRCAPGTWDSNHGHHLLASGNFLFFSNGAFGGSDPSHFYEYALDASDTLTASQVTAYKSSNNARSNTLGDVQRLPNGNTLVTFSNDGLIQEVDSSSQVVQSLSAAWFGYAEWRPTLYGPPQR